MLGACVLKMKEKVKELRVAPPKTVGALDEILQHAGDAPDLRPVATFLQLLDGPMERGLVMLGRGHEVTLRLRFAGQHVM